MEKPLSFQSLVSTLEDPRQHAKVLYPLDEILLLCLCGVVSGCESFVDIVEYGAEKLRFLRRFADFEHGIPSHNTLSTVFRALDPEPFNAVFAARCETFCTRCALPLGYPKPIALGVGYDFPRRRQPRTKGSCPEEFCHHQAHGHEPAEQGKRQKVPVRHA